MVHLMPDTPSVISKQWKIKVGATRSHKTPKLQSNAWAYPLQTHSLTSQRSSVEVTSTSDPWLGSSLLLYYPCLLKILLRVADDENSSYFFLVSMEYEGKKNQCMSLFEIVL